MDRVRVLNNKIIEGHSIYQKYGTTLYDLSKKDYPNKNYFALHRNIKCISLDAYEASISGDNDKTMDAAIGTNFFSNGRNSSPQLLLVELRMGYKSTNNLSMSKMLSKFIILNLYWVIRQPFLMKAISYSMNVLFIKRNLSLKEKKRK